MYTYSEYILLISISNKECAVYSSCPHIASKPGSSPPERPGLDNITSVAVCCSVLQCGPV